MRSRTGQRRVEARGGLNLPAHQPLYHPAIEHFHTVKIDRVRARSELANSHFSIL
jgi:hypothetical protein